MTDDEVAVAVLTALGYRDPGLVSEVETILRGLDRSKLVDVIFALAAYALGGLTRVAAEREVDAADFLPVFLEGLGQAAAASGRDG